MKNPSILISFVIFFFTSAVAQSQDIHYVKDSSATYEGMIKVEDHSVGRKGGRTNETRSHLALTKVFGKYVSEDGSVWAPSSTWFVTANNPDN